MPTAWELRINHGQGSRRDSVRITPTPCNGFLPTSGHWCSLLVMGESLHRVASIRIESRRSDMMSLLWHFRHHARVFGHSYGIFKGTCVKESIVKAVSFIRWRR